MLGFPDLIFRRGAAGDPAAGAFKGKKRCLTRWAALVAGFAGIACTKKVLGATRGLSTPWECETSNNPAEKRLVFIVLLFFSHLTHLLPQ